MSLSKETIEINKVLGLALLWIISCFIFQCTVTGEFMGERGPACLSFLCLVLIRGSLKPPQRLHTHQVLLIIPSSLPVYSTTPPFFSKFDFKFASSWEPSHVSPPTATCWLTTPYSFPHSSVFFCTTVRSYIYIVSVTRALAVPSHPRKPRAI